MGIERFVNALEQLFGSLAWNIFRHPDGNGDINHRFPSFDTYYISAIEPLCDLARTRDGMIASAVEQHNEFIAAPAANEIVRAHVSAQTSPHLFQNLIATQMPKLVVDGFKVIQIEQ